MKMNDYLKMKYTDRNEPRQWYNIAGKKNVTQWGGGGNGNSRAKGKHIVHPRGCLSGRRPQPRNFGPVIKGKK